MLSFFGGVFSLGLFVIGWLGENCASPVLSPVFLFNPAVCSSMSFTLDSTPGGDFVEMFAVLSP